VVASDCAAAAAAAAASAGGETVSALATGPSGRSVSASALLLLLRTFRITTTPLTRTTGMTKNLALERFGVVDHRVVA
jgi:hypothetical protein